MKQWLIPGAGVLAAVAAIAVVVVAVASPFDSDDNSARTTADTKADSARCASDAPGCVDPNSGPNEEFSPRETLLFFLVLRHNRII